MRILSNTTFAALLTIASISTAHGEEITRVNFSCTCPQGAMKENAPVTTPVTPPVRKEVVAPVVVEQEAKAAPTKKIIIQKTEKRVVAPVIKEAKPMPKKEAPEEIREGFFIEAKGGISNPKKLKKDFVGTNSKNSGVYEVRGGYNSKHYGVDLTLGYDSKYRLRSTSTNDDGDAFIHTATAESLSATLNSYYNIIQYQGITPYVGIGAGISRNKLSPYNVQVKFAGNNNYQHYKVRDGASATSLTYNIMAGVRVKLNKDIEISAEYKYKDLGKIKTGKTYKLWYGAVRPDEVSKSKLKSNSFLLGFRYYY